jgi:amino acid transporter
VFTLLPFVIFFFMAIPQVNFNNFVQPVVWEKVQWGPYLNCIFWNINYWDSASTLAGEVKDPRTTYPRGLMLALVVVVGCYLLPLTAGVGVNDPADEWREGYLVTLAIKVGGPALGIWVLAASAVSNIGQFAAEMSSDAFLLQVR